MTAFQLRSKVIGKDIEERTGEQLSIVEIRKGSDGRFMGKLFIVILMLVVFHLRTVPNVQRLIQINQFWFGNFIRF